MKKILMMSLILSFCTATVMAQSDSTEADMDTVKISWGKKKIFIVGMDEDEIEEMEPKKTPQRYNHFAGLDLGINGFVGSNNSLDLQKDAQFLDLNYRNSVVVGLNLWEKYIPFAKEKFGLVTGLGIEYANYDLSRDVDIVFNNDSTFAFTDDTKSFSKNKFKTTFLNVPLMFETNLGKDAESSFHLVAGAIVGYRLGSKTKQKFKQDGENYKEKDRGDYNINPWRLSATARIGYGNFTLFATYSLTEMFEGNKGPEVIPFTVGISLLTFGD